MEHVEKVVYAVRETDPGLTFRAESQYGQGKTLQIPNSAAKGICAKYNLAIEQTLSEIKDTSHKWLVFSHDDVDLLSRKEDLEDQIRLMGVRGAEIIAVAGNCAVPPVTPGAWWFGLVSGRFKGSGAVVHQTPNAPGMHHVESYGPYPQQIAAFDGLWFAVSLTALKTKPSLRFDADRFDGYHYYDADFSATARCLSIPMWACGIMVSHNKWGRGIEDPEFARYQKVFVQKWQNRADYYRYSPSKQQVAFVDSTVAFPTQN